VGNAVDGAGAAVVSDICARYRERTVFTRFVTPEKPEDRRGQWQAYFTKWQCATRSNLPSGALDVVPGCALFAAGACRRQACLFGISRLTARSFADGAARRDGGGVGRGNRRLRARHRARAVDLGFRVVIVQDALCSSSDTGHDALMTMLRTRFHGQIDLVNANELFDLWRPE
jgi:hypothetical protein